jgi:glycosyltransferase involved in cell wall biosynthesis
MNIILIAIWCSDSGSEGSLGYKIIHSLSLDLTNNIHVITTDGGDKYQSSNVKYYQLKQYDSILFHFLFLRKFFLKKKYTNINLIIQKILQENQIDIIHHVNSCSFLTLPDLREFHLPKIAGALGGGQKLLKKFINKSNFIRNFIRNVGIKISLTRNYRKIMKDYTLLLSTNIETKEAIEKINKNSLLYCEFSSNGIIPKVNSLNSSKIKLVAAGQYIYRKGFELLIKAIALVKNKDKIELSICGRGKLQTKYEKLIKKYNLGNVVFLKWLSRFEFLEYLSAMDLFIFPSICESGGQVNIEALDRGVPIVSFDAFAMKDFFRDSKSVSLINVDKSSKSTIQELADKIDYLIENPEQLRKMSESTILDVNRFSLETRCKEMLDYYKLTIEMFNKNGKE